MEVSAGNIFTAIMFILGEEGNGKAMFHKHAPLFTLWCQKKCLLSVILYVCNVCGCIILRLLVG